MATFTDPAELARKLQKIGKAYNEAQPAAVEKVALQAKRILVANGSKYPLHFGRKSTKLSAKYPPAKRTGDGRATTTVTATPPGPWKFVEKGSYRHPGGWVIRPRKKSKRAVVTPYGVFAHVHHPGLRSLGHPWEESRPEIKSMAESTYAAAMAATFSKAVR